MRKVGIYYAFWTHEWDVDFLPYVKKVKELGFDQLEVNGGTLANMSEDDKKRLADETRAHDVILSYGIGLTADKDVSSLDETVRKQGVEFMKRMIASVGSMGGGMIGGTVHSCWPASLDPQYDTKKPFLDQSIRSMKEMAKVAEDAGVILNVEVINRFEQFLLNVADEAVAYVEEVNSPAVRILLDTFHMNIEEDSFRDAILKAGPYLSALHAGETNRKPPGMGRIPWQEIKQALDEINFDGPIVMEPFVMPGGTVGQNIAVWRPVIENPDLDELARKAAQFVREHLF
jgi:D-psicose/D-tagatose/L-ribulose 3-epimerase